PIFPLHPLLFPQLSPQLFPQLIIVFFYLATLTRIWRDKVKTQVNHFCISPKWRVSGEQECLYSAKVFLLAKMAVLFKSFIIIMSSALMYNNFFSSVSVYDSIFFYYSF